MASSRNTLFIQSIRRQDDMFRTRMFKYFNKITKDANKALAFTLSYDKSDANYLEDLKAFIKPRKTDTARASYRLDDLANDEGLFNNKHSYLDVGSADGFITEEFKTRFNIKEAYGIDIHASQRATEKDTKLIQYDGEHFPFDNGTFDVVSAYMSLHHVDNLPQVLSEIRRVLHACGVLVVREHDPASDGKRSRQASPREMQDSISTRDQKIAYYDAVHVIEMCVVNTETSIVDTLDMYYNKKLAYYKTKKEWMKKITEAGFEFLYSHLPLYEGKEVADRFDSVYLFFTVKEATEEELALYASKQLGVNVEAIPGGLETWTQAINVEKEHSPASHPRADIGRMDIITFAKIALAHLIEYPDYYQRLKKMKDEGEKYWKDKEKPRMLK